MRGRPWLAGATIAALLAAVVGLQAAREGRKQLGTVDDSILYLRSPAVLRRVALSYDALLADVYWLRTVQHYGRTKLSSDPNKRYDLLYPLLDLTTSLDPRFNVAYRFGAIFLAEPFPGGPGRPDQAIALLRKGLREQPQKWEFAEDIGFTYYWWLHEYEEAAKWFKYASTLPGAPNWIAPLAAVTLAQGGNRESSRQLWQEVQRGAEVGWLKNAAGHRLMQLDAMDQIDQLRDLVAAYTRRVGRPPAGWRDLVLAGWLRGIPVDPTGSPYQLRADTVEVGLDPQSPLNPLPLEPARSG